MNLSTDQKAEIVRLRMKGLSLDKIVAETGVSKPYVQAICNLSEPALSGIQTVAENKPAPFVHQTRPEDWKTSNSVELEYKDRRIKDLEETVTELRKSLNTANTDLATTEKKLAVLQIENDTKDLKHEYEKNNIIAQNQYQKTSGLNGLADKVLTPIFANEKLTEALVLGIMTKLSGTDAAPKQALPSLLHPLLEDKAVGAMVKEIYEVFKGFKTEDIEPLHTLIGCFLACPGLLAKTSEKALEYYQSKQPQQPQ